MNDLGFAPVFSPWVIVGFLLPLFGLFCWLEFQRVQNFLVSRLVALGFILISILGFLLKPSYQSQAEPKETALLAPGFDKAKVDSLLKVKPHIKIFRTASAENYSLSKAISFQQLAGENINYIFGEGLPGFELKLLRNTNFQFIKSRRLQGVSQLYVFASILANQKNRISGVVHVDAKTKLTLLGPAGVEDSTVLKNGANDFTFFFSPKQTGQFIYKLTAEVDGQQTFSEKIPITVAPGRTLKILFVQSFPTAEVRHLKNYLAEKGHSIASLIQTSKNAFSEEFINHPKRRLAVTAETLRSFDLLFIDGNSVAAQRSGEKDILKKSVVDGLGLVLLDPTISLQLKPFSFEGKNITTDTAHFYLSGKRRVLPSLPLEIIEQPWISVVTKNKKRILSGSQFYGKGKIGFQLLRETYRLVLEGNNDDFAQIWSQLIDKTARSESRKFEVKINSPFPLYPNEPIDLTLISSGEKPSVFSDHTKIPIGEDLLIDDFWHAKVWTDGPGWHQLIASDSTVLNYYVSSAGEWKSLRAVNYLRETESAQELFAPAVEHIHEQKGIPAILFFVIFLIAGGFLWLAPKI